MSDAPIPTEMPIKTTLSELAKPAGNAAIPPSPETPNSALEKSPAPEDARKTLEAIAAGPDKEGTPKIPDQADLNKPEQTAELGPNKEKVDSILSQGSQLLLDAGDRRATLTALAHQAAPTPLGMELRRDVVQAIAEMKLTKLTPEQTATLTSLQKDIAALDMLKTDPARSEFAKFLDEYSTENPDKAIPAPIIEAIRTNKLDRAAEMANILQTDSKLSAKLNEQFKGDRTEPLNNVATPDGLLKAAGLPATPENTANVAKLLEPPPPPDPKSAHAISDFVMPTLMGVALVSMFLNQFTGSGESGGGGH